MAYRVQQLGSGLTIDAGINYLDKAKELVSNMEYAFVAQAIQDVLVFEEKRNDRVDLASVLKHAAKYGMSHLSDPVSGLSLREAFDLDIKVIVLMGLAGIVTVLMLVIQRMISFG